MMTKIKYAVFFFLGSVYGWAVTYTILNPVEKADNPIIIPAIVITFLGGFGIIAGIVIFLAENWKNT